MEWLVLWDNEMTELPKEVGSLTKLTNFPFSNNQLTYLPKEIGNLTSLNALNLSHNQLSKLPVEICNLTSVKSLNLSKNPDLILTEDQKEWINKIKGSSFDYSFVELDNDLLDRYKMNKSEKTSWINRLWYWADMNHISNLTWHVDNNIEQGGFWSGLSRDKKKLLTAEYLILQREDLYQLPSEIGNLMHLTSIYINKNHLNKLPAEISKLVNLTLLDLSDNELTELPEETFKLIKLRSLYCHDNNG